jgi:hypothetical protein
MLIYLPIGVQFATKIEQDSLRVGPPARDQALR